HQAEKERMMKELSETSNQINRLQNLLNSPFAEKAPTTVIEMEREKLRQYQETAEKIKEQLDKMK
ncbi:MAG TPA: hypothetical protein VK856_16490, partial [Anaerolineaceae bacterium]|nr:hypothetical protein [Anaerolineaceae bacterium]